jgi:hypothetical protein
VRILLIGGAHVIGTPVIRESVEQSDVVTLFPRGETHAESPPAVEHILGDRHDLANHEVELRRFAPEVVVDMIAYTQPDARSLVESLRGRARRTVVIGVQTCTDRAIRTLRGSDARPRIAD